MPLPLYLLAAAVFAMGTSEFMLAGLTPDIAAGLGVSTATAGLLTSAFAVGMVVGAPTTAALARRWPPRAALLTFLSVFAGCHVVGALTDDFGILVASRVVAAVVSAGFLSVALSTVTALVAPDRTARALAVLLSGTTLATIVGVPGGAALGSLLDWRATFWSIVILCAFAMIGVAAIDMRRDQEAPRSAGPRLADELRVITRPRLVMMMLLGVLVNAATFATFTYLAPVVTDVAGLGDLWVPLALFGFGVGSFCGVTVAGRLADRRPFEVVALGGPALLVGWIVLAVGGSVPELLLPMTFVQGTLCFAVGSTVIARILAESHGAPTMGGSYATVALNLGAAVGPAVGGVMLGTAAGPLGPVWLSAGLVGAALVVGAVCWTVIRRSCALIR
ncbi:Cmx/CmrA family chloramphenicol efflux MFS transporter [Gordonia soli]|uniref:Putative drug resistance protein n=1 Tax=Gordonia soli NBRC 108243 TaxID=1223545 RepID=M0QL90_9ACTN|nr:Cmx/CmrA family chloramphenicol efflux MFS transporter [Gordonia soli]GAC69400.1 putative drug resistance protein [Gordonia soli NBRC 108243]